MKRRLTCSLPRGPRRFLGPFVVLLLPLLAGCSVGPDYVRPSAPTPATYKDTGNWKPSNPQDAVVRGKWWEIYHDAQLNALEDQVNISNQNVLQTEANFREAAAAVKIARAAFFPTVTTNPSITESQTQSLTGNSSSGGGTTSGVSTTTGTGTVVDTSGSGSRSGGNNQPEGIYDLPLQVSYLVDVWGSVRRNVEANTATAEATFADLESARLSYQGTLAQDYFSLRGIDAEAKLLGETVASYEKYLTLTKNRYASGIASRGDVAQADTQLQTTRAQLLDLGVQRAQYEHAIATLVGTPASLLTLKFSPLAADPPRVPAGVPSTLLERRPDIAGAERRMAAANADIGVEVAGYYPQITLSGSTGLNSVELADVFSGPNFLWSVGPALAQTIFDAGRTHGLVQEAQATYDGTVAAYRETVLTAFQQIEDDLSGLRILESEGDVEDEAVKSAQQSLTVTTNTYQAGTADYLQVITTQAILLNDQVTAVNIHTRRMTTSVLLVEALGGGWKSSDLPGRAGVADVPQAQDDIDRAKPTPPPTLRTAAPKLR
jgi:NodT family efflux transporter outer membrane factor (OMF) lipoprotein